MVSMTGNMKMDEDSWKKIKVGQLFKVGETGGHVQQIYGSIIDTEGNKHSIQDCEFAFWTQKDLDETLYEADKLYKELKRTRNMSCDNPNYCDSNHEGQDHKWILVIRNDLEAPPESPEYNKQTIICKFCGVEK